MTDTSQRLFGFVAAEQGTWVIRSNIAVTGQALPAAARLTVVTHPYVPDVAHAWCLHGITSHDRYVTRDEKDALVARQPPLGRTSAQRAAFIALSKNAQWWALTQGERRSIIEDQSRHIAIGMRYLPAIARRLYHCRDLSQAQPFDFLTWFEYAERDASAFDELLMALRESVEWRFVSREVDIRLAQADEP